uniref:Hepatitis A virus cellular receptor 1 n=1 Tax=Danio rerio TaxID=7955 RepID=A0A2R8QGQ2_DANRE|nr:hepatitis A virus cellular receptor 1 homolog isoform X1 [Danio rerio]|eukprot:XP_005161402.1 hepatitis A virus cellular receptor 1 homolog isoform X1 [Danio rerio]
MTDLHSWFLSSWILCCLTICRCSDIIVQSFEGDNVTLPCKYDSRYHGKCEICWMRGDIPSRGCGEEIIASDGDKVSTRNSDRYDLAGPIQHGDVSLTIFNIDKTDSGKYGCRVHVPGWFNDEKYYVHLIVDDAIIPTTLETTSMSSSTSEHETTGVYTTAMTEAPATTPPDPLVTTISGLLTPESQTTETSGDNKTRKEISSTISPSYAPRSSTAGMWLSNTTSVEPSVSVVYHESSSAESKDNVTVSAVLVPVLLLLLALIAIAAAFMWKQKKKTRASLEVRQNSEISVIYSNSGSSVGLYNREMAVENVYQIQAESEYEQWH